MDAAERGRRFREALDIIKEEHRKTLLYIEQHPVVFPERRESIPETEH